MKPLIDVDVQICHDLEMALRREWIITNGRAGYASSTVPGCNTRKYHGLLIATPENPSDRKLYLAGLEETLELGGKEYNLSTIHGPDGFHPMGNEHIVNLRLEPFPIITFAAGDWEIEKRIFMQAQRNTVVIRYRVVYGEGKGTLNIVPLVTCRGINEVQNDHNALSGEFNTPGHGEIVWHYGNHCTPLRLFHNAADVKKLKKKKRNV